MGRRLKSHCEFFWIVFAAFLLILPTDASGQERVNRLAIGSKAPDINVEHWISDNDGFFEHISKFKSGHVYVIEFWATWCDPSKNGMPHMAELQEKYKNEKLQIISISDESPEEINNFLEFKVSGDENERTFRELTTSYCLTTDPDKSAKRDYFWAAKRTGLPCAFIIGKTGLVEWIGYPANLDKPLKQVINDEWDREKFAGEYKSERETRQRDLYERRRLLDSRRNLEVLIQSDRIERAVEEIEKLLLSDRVDDEIKQDLSLQRVNLMVQEKMDGAAEAILAFAKVRKANASQSEVLNGIAWNIFLDQHAREDVPEDILDAAKYAAQVAVDASPTQGHIIDTLAHLVYVVDKDLDKAIALQKRAVKYGGLGAASLRPFLNDLEREKATGEKPKRKRNYNVNVLPFRRN